MNRNYTLWMLGWLYRKWVDESWHILLKRFWAGILEKKNELFIRAFVCGEGSIILSPLLDEPLVFKWTPRLKWPPCLRPLLACNKRKFPLGFCCDPVTTLSPESLSLTCCLLTNGNGSWPLAGMSADGEWKITGGYALCPPCPHHPTCDQLSTG